MRLQMTTLCYIEKDGKYLMLHRVSKKNDVNRGKWIGVGGHFEEGESPEECLLREVREETGLNLTSWQFRGLLSFNSAGWDPEFICVYTADTFTGELHACNEGELAWVAKEKLQELNLWEGDRIFLRLLAEDAPFFSLKLCYEGDTLSYAALDGKPLELLDVCDEKGNPTGRVTERQVAHTLGLMHRTVHIWVARRTANGWELLLQKRSRGKDSFPGRYDTSSAGHVIAGDGYRESALRELEEELGVRLQSEELHFCGLADSGPVDETFHGRAFRDREIAAVYVCFLNREAEEFKLQEDEVESVRWMDYESCLAAMEAEAPAFCYKNLPFLRLAGDFLKTVGETKP